MRRNHQARRKSDEKNANRQRYEGACIAVQSIAGERYEHPWGLKYITQSSSNTGKQDLYTTIIDLLLMCADHTQKESHDLCNSYKCTVAGSNMTGKTRQYFFRHDSCNQISILD